MNADDALEKLKQGNERFRIGRTKGPGPVETRREELVEGQRPFAVVLSCSDSRVPTEILFDTGLGDLFVIRVAGNVPNPSSIASVEYAVTQLETKLVVVMAHEKCGAVTAAIEGGIASVNLGVLFGYIRPALELSVEGVDAVARRNAHNTAERLVTGSDIIRNATDQGEVRIVTAFYRFADGCVEFD
jgi:carbonic anhydrase